MRHDRSSTRSSIPEPSFWVSGRLVSHLLYWAARQGLSERELTRRAGLPDVIPSSPHYRVPVEQQFALWRACADQLQPGFAITAGATMANEALPTIGPLLAVTKNLRGALRILADGGPLISNATVVRYVEHRDHGGLEMRLVLPSHPLEAVESALAHWTALLRSITDHSLTPHRIHLPFADTGRAHARLLQAPVRYGEDTVFLAYDKRDLDTPLHAHDADAEAVLRTILDRRCRENEGSLESRCRLALMSQNVTSTVRIKHAAEHLGMSTRTLQRGLLAEGVQFRAVLDRVLAERAMRLLTDDNRTIDDVADELGYRRRSFCRAFTRWTHTPPGTWRQLKQEDRAP